MEGERGKGALLEALGLIKVRAEVWGRNPVDMAIAVLGGGINAEEESRMPLMRRATLRVRTEEMVRRDREADKRLVE